MSGPASPSGAQTASNEATLSAMSTSQLGSAPKRIRHRENQIESAYELQKNAAIKGALLYTALGASSCFMAHHLFQGFRRQTLAFKGFITSGFAIFGFVVGADTVLLSHESQQRSEENMVRTRARAELGKKGIVASEKEIEKWKDEYIQQKLEERRLRREHLLRQLEESDQQASSTSSSSSAPVEDT
ncbi:uncharacterized protein MEPE_03662 [Melanopsichium pennsylvanicum]|uniref:Uncharacterized protein n=2 Tax=Melanopsichium pennsylvanicum TaxID=63383 RepID=A0AAJ4XPV9_9BASI|nr:conserved hypothetical protein [Melanopsichium pennsylvanicum 4]SNX84953.1 uncharacterized protein MEPE_03662 [Melanopsichium pennsylvanicum]